MGMVSDVVDIDSLAFYHFQHSYNSIHTISSLFTFVHLGTTYDTNGLRVEPTLAPAGRLEALRGRGDSHYH